ncbi:MAG: hypothetical protein NVS4B8_15330 [Herpetosiphon sp.]
MNEIRAGATTCLSEEESRELTQSWRTLQAKLTPLATLIEQGVSADCNALHTAFESLAPAYDEFERTVKRAQQLRLVHQGQLRPS